MVYMSYMSLCRVGETVLTIPIKRIEPGLTRGCTQISQFARGGSIVKYTVERIRIRCWPRPFGIRTIAAVPYQSKQCKQTWNLSCQPHYWHHRIELTHLEADPPQYCPSIAPVSMILRAVERSCACLARSLVRLSTYKVAIVGSIGR